MRNKINLGEVAKQVLNCKEPWSLQLKLAEGVTFTEIENICLEFGKQLLELAAENANANIERSLLNPTKPTSSIDMAIVDRQSILDTINQVE